MINFIKYRALFIGISVFLVCASLFVLTTKGFIFSVEFVGGGVAIYSTKTASASAAITSVAKETVSGVIVSTQKNTTTIRSSQLTKKQADTILSTTKKTGAQLYGFEKISPSISGDNVRSTIIALCISILIMLIYMGWVFKSWKYGVAAIVALLHDTILLLGAWALFGVLFGVTFDVLFVTAVLTIMSFSVHDTIVIFDKVKEEQHSGRFGSFADTINGALTLTMNRSVNNSFTIILMLSSLFILGGGAVRWFSLALLLGTFLGTYSSPFVATPTLYFLEMLSEKKRR